MPRMDLPDPVAKCPHCTVNLYSIDDKPARPIKFPCNISREKGVDGWKEDSFICPWETADEQEMNRSEERWEFLRGFMGKDSGFTDYE